MMDLISRQDVIDAVIKYCTKYDLRELLADIEVLPSAQKTGKWKHDGSQWENRWVCGCGYKLFFKPTNYCPNCGADMRGEEDG